jgi:hypothetical protein
LISEPAGEAGRGATKLNDKEEPKGFNLQYVLGLSSNRVLFNHHRVRDHFLFVLERLISFPQKIVEENSPTINWSRFYSQQHHHAITTTINNVSQLGSNELVT